MVYIIEIPHLAELDLLFLMDTVSWTVSPKSLAFQRAQTLAVFGPGPKGRVPEALSSAPGRNAQAILLSHAGSCS